MATPGPRTTRPFRGELVAAAVVQFLLLALLDATVGLGAAGWLAGTGYGACALTVLTTALRRTSADSLGPANRVTLIRAVLVGGVTALVADAHGGRTHTPLLVAVAATALVLDAVDGPVARRTGSVSDLGARFDMEVDAFLILVLSVLVADPVGRWVWAIGAMRYVFAAAGRWLPWLRAPLPPRFSRKTVAALQGIILVVVAGGTLPHPAAVALTGAALALLVWSFGRDVVWLRRPPAAPPCSIERCPDGGGLLCSGKPTGGGVSPPHS